jgi:predicted nucleic acid-binding protein
MSPKVDMLIGLLKEAIENPKNRSERIKRFQQLVWDTREDEIAPGEQEIWDILNDLAADLDYYEPNEEWRREDPSFFGDEEVCQRILIAIAKAESADSERR